MPRTKGKGERAERLKGLSVTRVPYSRGLKEWASKLEIPFLIEISSHFYPRKPSEVSSVVLGEDA